MQVKAYAARSAAEPLSLITIERRAPGPTDVTIQILYCGVCHSDLHTARGEWAGVKFPAVPGHEIVGRVVAIGAYVIKVKVGDIVVDAHFVLRISHREADLPGVAPLLCVGITTWSPLRHWQAGPGKKVGIVGIGGLVHMGVKLAHALGAHVVAFTTSPAKVQDAHALGADEVVVSRNAGEMAAHARSFDFILNTVAAAHNLDAFTALLKRDGTMTLVGAPSTPHPSPSILNLIFGRQAIAGSVIGGIAETQEMLDFCAEKGITSDIEMIPMAEIETAYARMLKSDVKYRFVIDMATL